MLAIEFLETLEELEAMEELEAVEAMEEHNAGLTEARSAIVST